MIGMCCNIVLNNAHSLYTDILERLSRHALKESQGHTVGTKKVFPYSRISELFCYTSYTPQNLGSNQGSLIVTMSDTDIKHRSMSGTGIKDMNALA